MVNNGQLPRSTPEAQGISSKAILSFLESADELEHLHSLMILRHGNVITEGYWLPYQQENPHMLFSLSKSFTSTAVGLAIHEGLLSLDDKVISFFPESDLPSEISENLAKMTVHHLLSMNTGHHNDTMEILFNDSNWTKMFFSAPVEHEPGSYFVYNTGATYILGVIVQQLTGQSLVEYLQPRIFEPLGITYAAWDQCPRGFDVGGWGLNITTDSIARFGQLYLQRGVWHGKQLIPEEWVATATSFHSDNSRNETIDWQQGYGYQFWRSQHNAYRGDGAFGQYCLVMPDQDVVIAITSGLQNMQRVLDRVWEKLLPAFQSCELPEDRASHDALENALSRLVIKPVQGQVSSPRAAAVSGKVFHFGENELGMQSLSISSSAEEASFTFNNGDGDHKVDLGVENWRYGKVDFHLPMGETQLTAGCGAWIDDDTFVADVFFYEAPYRFTHTFHFLDDNTVEYIWKLNVSFGPTDAPTIIGKAN
jgi:CubicO group peptidase (beta-lactamase class C family)